MILLLTDFSGRGPYVGQLEAAILHGANSATVVNLMHDLPRFRPRFASYLIPPLAREFPAGSIFVCVVDPGVGGDRAALVLRAEDQWFVGPDNGLLNGVAAQAKDCACWRVDWRPKKISPTFHGRDLFAPIAVQLHQRGQPPGEPTVFDLPEWPQDLDQIIYIDDFGNAASGRRVDSLPADAEIQFRGVAIEAATTFSDVGVGETFWYENSLGLLALAVNQGSAARRHGLILGEPIQVSRGPQPTA